MFRRLVLPAFVSLFVAALPTADAQGTTSSRPATATLDRYVGQYCNVNEPEIILSVFHDGNHLAIESARSPHQDLVAESASRFTIRETPLHLEFITDAGKITGVERKAGSSEVLYERIGDRPVLPG